MHSFRGGISKVRAGVWASQSGRVQFRRAQAGNGMQGRLPIRGEVACLAD
jgi:hypothetical protein